MRFLSDIHLKCRSIGKAIYNSKWLHPVLYPFYEVVIKTFIFYFKRRVFRLGAAMAYYTIFSLPAILIVIIGMLGYFLGESAVEGQIYQHLVDVLGQQSALQIEKAVASIGSPSENYWATLLGLVVLLFVATGVFYALQEALNQIFQVEELPRKTKLLENIINRALSIGVVLSIGGLLLLSMLSNAILQQLSIWVKLNEPYLLNKIPEDFQQTRMIVQYMSSSFISVLNLCITLFLIALFFALLYKILPAVKLATKYVMAGALFAASLFWVGQIGLNYYIKNTNFVTAYGAAGSLIVVLVWVYYNAQLIFLGAEFIRAISQFKNYKIQPKRFAKMLQKKANRSIHSATVQTELDDTNVDKVKISLVEPTNTEDSLP